MQRVEEIYPEMVKALDIVGLSRSSFRKSNLEYCLNADRKSCEHQISQMIVARKCQIILSVLQGSHMLRSLKNGVCFD